MSIRLKVTLLFCLNVSLLPLLPAVQLQESQAGASALYWMDNQGNCQSRFGGIGSINLRDNLRLVGREKGNWTAQPCKPNWSFPDKTATGKTCIDLTACAQLFVLSIQDSIWYYADPTCGTSCD